jgi:sugar/nucleoside kinase (ribokinase family)
VQALILGGVAWNTMVSVSRFPDPRPHTVFATGTHEAVGSSGAGKALNLASLGVDVTLWALVGRDEPGDRIRATMADAGVEFIPQWDPEGTARHINLMEPDGERISIFANAGSFDIDIDTEQIRDEVDRADVISVTILNHCRAFLPLVARSTAPIWVDIHDYDGVNPYHRDFIDAADHLMMSSIAMANWRTFAEDRIADGTRVVLCTHGSRGASGIARDHGWVDVPAAKASHVVDTNGAGDAFFAGFVTSWMSNNDLERAMTSGAVHAARAVASPDLAGQID